MKTTRHFLSFLVLGALLADGCGDKGDPGLQGDPGDPGEKGDRGDKGDPGKVAPALALLTPSTLYPGRSAVLQLSGVGTAFTSSSQVSFGDTAIKVAKVEAGSNANLRITVDVGLDARLGAHEVKVISPRPDVPGDIELKLAGGLWIAPSLAIESEAGPMGMMVGPSAPQGGFVDVGMRNLDFRDNPLGTAPRLAAPLSLISTTTLTAAASRMVALVDALAPAGATRTALTTTNPLGQPVGFVADPMDAAALKVTARAATELKSGVTKTSETLPARRATNLYKVTTTTDNQLVQLTFTGFGSGLSAMFGPRLSGNTAPASGAFRDGRALDTSATPGMVMGTASARTALWAVPKAGDTYFTIYASDLNGSLNHGYSVTAKVGAAGALGSLKEPMMGDTPMAPLATITELDKAYVGTDGAIDSNLEYDYIKFKAKQSGRVFLAVSANPGITIGLGVRGADCSVFVTAATYSSTGAVVNEFDAKAGDTYCLRVFGDSNGTTPYQIIISPGL